MKIVFRDRLHHLDFNYKVKDYQLDLSEILYELAEQYPDLQGKSFRFSYLHSPLESFWSIDYLCQQFGLQSFDCIEIEEEHFLPLTQIKDLQDLLEVKNEQLAFALREISSSLIISSFSFLSEAIQQKIQKNVSSSLFEILENQLKPLKDQVPPNFKELIEALIFQGEMFELKEKEEKTTQKLKKLLRKKDNFLSQKNQKITVSEEEDGDEEDLHRLSSLALKKQEELQQQEKQEQHLFEQFSTIPSHQKELLDALLEEDPICESEKSIPVFVSSEAKEEINEKYKAPSEETKKVLINDGLFESSTVLQEDLPHYPAEIEKDTASLKVLRPVDHLFEDLELPANTPTGHNIDELFNDESAKVSVLEEESPEELTSDIFDSKEALLSHSKEEVISSPKEEEEEKEEETVPTQESLEKTQKSYILSKQQLLVAGYALRKPPPGKIGISSADDSDANLPVQESPPTRASLLLTPTVTSPPVPESTVSSVTPNVPKLPAPDLLKKSVTAFHRKESARVALSKPTEEKIGSKSYYFHLEIIVPTPFLAFHPSEITLNIQTECDGKPNPTDVLGKIVLDSPEFFLTAHESPLPFGKETHRFLAVATKSGTISVKVLIFIQEKIVGEFPLELKILPPPKKFALWTLGLAGGVGSLGQFILPNVMSILMFLLMGIFFFTERRTFSEKTKHLSFELHVNT